MRSINSLLAGIILYCLISYLLNLPDIILSLIFLCVGSQIHVILPKNYKTSFIILIPLLLSAIFYPLVFIPMSIGFISSIFICLLGRDGCKLLYPINKTTFTGPSNYLEDNSRDEKAATTFLFVLAVITIIFSLFGTSIISDIEDGGNIINYYNNRPESSYYKGSGENKSGYVHYVYVDPSKIGFNYNITTTNYNNTTTTIISEYIKQEVV